MSTCPNNTKSYNTTLIILGAINVTVGLGLLIPGAILLAKAQKNDNKGAGGWIAMIVIGVFIFLSGTTMLATLPLTKVDNDDCQTALENNSLSQMNNGSKLCVVAIFKNESHILKEWLRHHKNQGVSHFFMIDNGSTDEYEKELKGFPVTVVKDSTRHQQPELYNKHFLQRVIDLYDWVAVIDLDEFLYGRKGNTVQSYLASLEPTVASIEVQWKMFGSNGHKIQPSSVIDGFVRRRKMSGISCVKSIVNTSYLIKFNIHSHHLKNGKVLRFPLKGTESSLSEAPLHINHYAIQSKDWFMKVKAIRGDVGDKKADTIRNLKYFKDYDWNEIFDDELSRLTRKP